MSKDDLVVVTGAGGFIGGHLVKVLQQRGHTKIRAVDVKPLDEWYQKHPGVENQVGDLALLEACRAAAKGATMVYNLASDMGGMGFIENNKALCMLSRADQHAPAAWPPRKPASSASSTRPRPASTTATSRPTPTSTALKEEDAYPAMPEDGYGWEKLFSERMCRHFREDFGIADPRRPLPQRLRPGRHLGRRPREGARRDLPQGHRRQALRQARDRDLGRRQADPLVHVHRRLPQGHDHAHRQRHHRADQPRLATSWSPSTSWSTSSRRSPASS